MIALFFWICVGLIVYVYALYPALLWLLTRFFKKTLRPHKGVGTEFPSVTLLISAYREEAVIAKKLENSLAIDYPSDRLQILVAVDGQEDRTREIVESFAEKSIVLSYSPQRTGKINAISRAVRASTGEIIVLTDANTFFAPDALKKLVEPALDPAVGAVSGAKVILREGDTLSSSEGLYWKYESFIKQQESDLNSCTGVSGEIFAFRRELFEPPPSWVINDDFYLAMQILRKGYRVVYIPGALTYERISLSAQDEGTRRRRIATGRTQALWMGADLLPWNQPVLIWQIFSHKFFRLALPFAMFGALLANLAAVVWPTAPTTNYPWIFLSSNVAWLFLILQVLFYGTAGLGAWLQRDHKAAGWKKVLYLPAFLVNSNLAVLFGFVQAFSRRQANLWQRVARRSD